MLCPEIKNFPCPKIVSSEKIYNNLESMEQKIRMNNFYKSIVITVPDELQIPNIIEEYVHEDSEYYKIYNCSLSEFVEPVFIEHFVKNGRIHCLSSGRKCIVQNCAAITPDGILTLHVLDFIFQTIGLEGKKLPHNYYEIRINLKELQHQEKIKCCLKKLEVFDFYIIWEPNDSDVCPSSIAKYFDDRGVTVTVETIKSHKITPHVTEIPSIKDASPQEMSEWIGMLAIGGNLTPSEPYVSTYSQPESEYSLKSSRICLCIAKGIFTPTLVINICKKLFEYVSSRELDNYWVSLSLQSHENSLWQWNPSTPKMFQSQNNSSTMFFTHDHIVMYSAGEIKYP